MAATVILVEAKPRQAADGIAVPVRLAGLGGLYPYFYGEQHYSAGIAGLPRTIASIDFDGEQLGGGGVPQAMELRWSPAGRALLAEAAALYWTDAPITVRIGPEGDAMPPITAAGLVLDSAIEAGALRIALSDAAADLKKPLLTDRFAGTSGIEGPVELDGIIKSRAWGRCFNVPGQLIDRAANIWCFGDPRRAWQSFVQVRDRGVALTVVQLLGWQGTAEATFAALKGAAVVDGGCIVCPSIACVKMWTQATGDLKADIEGEVAGGYVETAPEIVARLVAVRSAIPIAAGALAEASAWRPAPTGWRIDNDTTTAADAISELLGDVSLSWLLIGGQLRFRRWEWTASTRVAHSHRVTRRSTVKPVGTRKLGYRRNWSPMARGDLAAIVLAQDVAYEDGTPVEDLKPAQPGADVTKDHTSKDTNAVGGRPVASVLDGIDGNTFGRALLAAEAELARIRTRALSFPGPEGEDSYTLHRREVAQRKAADQVFAETFEILGARTADGQAFVLNVATVRISGQESLAQRFAAISVAFQQNAASIEHIDQVLVGPTGALARALVRLDVNGRIVGTALTNNGNEGAFVIAADKVRIEDPDTGKPYLYADDTGKVLMRDVEVDTLKVGTVDFDDMQLGAAQKAAWTTLAADFQVAQGQTLAVFTLAFVKEDKDSVLEIQAFLNAYSPDDLQFDVTIQVDGMVMQTVPRVNLILDRGDSQAQAPITPFVFAGGIAAGPHTITVKVYNRETDSVPLTIQVGSTLKVVELRKGSIGSSTGSGAAIPPPADTGGGGGGDYEGGGGRTDPNQQVP